jgi:hypothetical protein
MHRCVLAGSCCRSKIIFFQHECSAVSKGIIRSCLDTVNVVAGVVEDDEVERLVSLYLGELAVALGATSDLFSFYNDPATDEPYGYVVSSALCLDGTAASHLPAIVQQNSYGLNAKSFFEITTPLVTQVAKNIFGCQSLTGARIENHPFKPSVDAGLCIGDGWDSRLFHEEVLATHVSQFGFYLFLICSSLYPYD